MQVLHLHASRFRSAGWMLVLFLLGSCGEKREITYLQHAPIPVITIDETVTVTLGSFVGETEAVNEQFAPKKVTLDAKIVDLGNHKYVLKTSWAHEGPLPSYWSLKRYDDRNDGSEEFEPKGAAVVRKGEALEDTSLELEGNRKYRFVLIANIYEPFNKPPASGSVKYKTILVNLKGLQS